MKISFKKEEQEKKYPYYGVCGESGYLLLFTKPKCCVIISGCGDQPYEQFKIGEELNNYSEYLITPFTGTITIE
jgi:hypothetical protein